jgi:hypothetical protein
MVHRIDDPTAAATLPAPRPQGTPGYFTMGSTGSTGFPATIVRYEFMNMLQEELANVVAAGGIALDKNDNAQLLKALSTVLGGGFTQVTSSQVLHAPAWAHRIAFRAVGGGGGGAHCQATGGNHLAGGGGGAGGYAEATYGVTPGGAVTCTIGGGGAAEAGGGQTVVTDSSSWTVTCAGGGGAAWYSNVGCTGGSGGASNGAQFLCNGGYGGDGQSGGGVVSTGFGAPGPWGGGVRAGQGGGLNGGGPGAGGSGAYDNGSTNVLMNGGAGAAGLIQYRWLP